MSFIMEWVEHGGLAYRETVELRRVVLRLPLGLDFSAEELQGETQQHHLHASLAGELVGCLVLLQERECMARVRQVAVSPNWQGHGFGRELMLESERRARELGFDAITLCARANVIPFYESLGYTTHGDEFEEVGLPHRLMTKNLR